MTLLGKKLVVEDKDLKKKLSEAMASSCSYEALESVLPGLSIAAAQACASLETRSKVKADRIVVRNGKVQAFPVEHSSVAPGPAIQIVPPH